MKKIITLFILVLAMLLCIVACSPKTADEAGSSLEDQGYYVVEDTLSVPSLIYAMTGAQPTSFVSATKDGEAVYVFFFRNKDATTMAYDYIASWAGTRAATGKVIQDGTTIYFGTEQGIKDFR